MNDLETILLYLVAFGLVGLTWKYRHYDRMQRRAIDVHEQMEKAFEEYLFKLPGGAVRGRKLILIAKEPPAVRPQGLVRLGDEGAGSTWYCMGPGPSYLVAKAVYQIEWHGVRIEFATRYPDADRFREMLEGNAAALAMLSRRLHLMDGQPRG